MASQSWIFRSIFSVISLAAFMGNALILVVYFKSRNKVKIKPFDTFIISLAVTDLLTAVFIVFSRFLYQPSMPTSQPQAFIVCHFLWGGYVLFGFGYVSVYTCLALSCERWLAVTKPFLYRRVSTVHPFFAVVFVWCLGFLLNAGVFVSVDEDFQTKMCKWIKPKFGANFIPYVEIGFGFILPFLVIIILYLHLFYVMRRGRQLTSGRGPKLKRRMTVLALVACVALLIGWLPAKISYLMRFTSGGEHFHGVLHTVFIIFTFGNSCVNPVIYGLCSSRLRNECKEVLKQLFYAHCFKK